MNPAPGFIRSLLIVPLYLRGGGGGNIALRLKIIADALPELQDLFKWVVSPVRPDIANSQGAIEGPAGCKAPDGVPQMQRQNANVRFHPRWRATDASDPSRSR